MRPRSGQGLHAARHAFAHPQGARPPPNAVCAGNTAASQRRTRRADTAPELLPERRVVREDTPHRVGRRHRRSLLDASHRHAHVVALHDDRHPSGLHLAHQRGCNLLREPLLDLQPPRVEVRNPRELGEAEHDAAGEVTDVYPAVEGQQVVLAQRVKLDVAHDDHPAHGARRISLVDAKLGVADDIAQLASVARREEAQRLGGAQRRSHQALARGVLADRVQQRLEGHNQRQGRLLLLVAVCALHVARLATARGRHAAAAFLRPARHSHRWLSCSSV
mmetsp:Transcript_24844/g.65528  ORF Transcript_24844/g.65528 Transcript_24844/m.65528 type:complete len:277 (+) Transcript_24844:203-1033(+)